MIVTLQGIVSEKLGSLVVLDANGVGYGVSVASEDAGQIKTGETLKLYVYEHIRENGYDLYGFSDLGKKALFTKLLDVNGVGPKMALSIMNIGSAGELKSAIVAGDVVFLQSAAGVGKRLAERILVDLKDKIAGDSFDSGFDYVMGADSQPRDEALEALLQLGYSQNNAVSALAGIDRRLPAEDRIKLALRSGKL